MDEQKRQRYLKRRSAKAQLETRTLQVVPDRALVEMYWSQPVDTGLVDEILSDMERRFDIPTQASASPGAADALLADIKQALDQEKISLLLTSCRDSVLDAIIRPFGLSAAMFDDKTGGNVTTVHNFENDVVATSEDAARLEGFRDPFKRRKYEQGFPQRRKQIFQKEEPLVDAYTGKELPKDGRAHIDHVVSAHEIDQDSRAHLFLSEAERSAMATSDSNTAMTHHSLNQSKSDKRMDEWLDKTEKDGRTKAERFEVDREKATAIDKAARKAITGKLRTAQFKKQGSALVRTGYSEGVRMGLQQSLGLLLREFVLAVFDQARDIFDHGFNQGKMDSSFWAVLKERLGTIWTRVISKWKDVLVAFRDGAISGFFSNLVTFLINCLMTTVARVGRVIREGFFSLFRALKIVLFPPAGLTLQEAAHEATKLIGAALVTTGGILLEELVDKFIQSIPVLGQIASLITPVILGMITGLTTSITVYLIDKVDLLGVVAGGNYAHVIARLDEITDGLVEQAEASYAVFQLPIVDF